MFVVIYLIIFIIHSRASCCPRVSGCGVRPPSRGSSDGRTSYHVLCSTLFPDTTLLDLATIRPYYCCPLPGPLKMDGFLKPSRPSTIDKRVPLRRDESTETRSSYVSTTPGSGASEWEEEERVHSPVQQGETKEVEPMSPIVVVCRCKMSADYRQILLTQSLLQCMLWHSI